ncbi:MAG: GWxTD domain-containing protein [Terracidiphilus sp.]|nr:GWxTD domain-containing protein [Terracidiphilus sp.]MDR3798029.1 GWxTD domain-containing protein [Terracidiphilus sp.]
MMFNSRHFLFTALSCGLISVPAVGLLGQQSAAPAPTQQAQPAAGQGSGQGQEADPMRRQLSDKERYRAQKELRRELKGPYKTWLNEEVPYIISDDERKAFMSLANDEEREAFIENFWQRRNPNPDSPENEFREEHYRRIQYANDHFAAGKPGWKTDRGHIYIAWGPADSIDSHPSGGMYERPMEEGGGETSTFPFEVWHYRYLEGMGENIDFEFVDTCQCGDYHFTIDRSEKDALKYVPGAGLTQWEEMNKQDKTNRFKGNGIEQLGTGPMGDANQGKEFDRIEMAAKAFAPPPVKFKDLESDLDAFNSSHKLMQGPVFNFDVRTDFVKVTDSMDLVPITLQIRNRDITFVTKDGVSKGVVNILGRVTTIMHKTVQTFEDTVEVNEPAELLEKSLDHRSLYWKALPLPPGLYRLDIAIKDVNNGDHIGIYGQSLNVPEFQDEKLGASSLILADQMNIVSSQQIGNGNFIISNMYVRPRVSENSKTPVSIKRTQSLNFWLQFYNLGIDEATKSNSATVTYQITDSTGAVILEKQLESKDLGAHSDQLTVEKTLPIAGLSPGKYKVTVKVNDAISKQEIAQSAPFIVE